MHIRVICIHALKPAMIHSQMSYITRRYFTAKIYNAMFSQQRKFGVIYLHINILQQA